jgi:hypothetical protein
MYFITTYIIKFIIVIPSYPLYHPTQKIASFSNKDVSQLKEFRLKYFSPSFMPLYDDHE